MIRRRTLLGALALLLLGTLAWTTAWSRSASTTRAASSIRVTEHDMHRFPGGVPPGWKFSIPPGDPQQGRKVFADLECYSCHEVQGESFPARTAGQVGPPLAGMGAEHPAEYFGESIVNPNAIVIDHPEYVAPDGTSRMPSFNDSLTVQQWIDLVAYLRSLTASGHDAHHHHHGPEREKAAGDYRVRIDYAEAEPPGHRGYVSVFVADATTGEPIPYLPVRLRIGAGKTARTVLLSPAFGRAGFHYGAAVTIPDETERVTVLLGRATARTAAGAPARYRTARQLDFEW